MPSPIEDYAIIGDCRTAALVSRTGSIDWLCLPRFDSGACFAALLGKPDHGRWLLAPAGRVDRVERAYRRGSLVLDTTFHDAGGTVVVTDFMPLRTGSAPSLVRIVRGVKGQIRMRTELVVRFDYGSVVPWMRKHQEGLVAVGGPDSLYVVSDVPLRGQGLTTVGEFDVTEGQTAAMSISWQPSHELDFPALRRRWGQPDRLA
jgi:GH15 family glucan-1,4-alpha-glucosidase